MKTIPLTHGLEALVDDGDYERLKGFSWCLKKDKNSKIIYANRKIPLGNGKYQNRKMHHDILEKRIGFIIDHKNRNGLDNQKHNLRYATFVTNGQNSGKHCDAVTSQFKGVDFKKEKRKWCARICLRGKTTFLGYFESEMLAKVAYDTAAKRMFGDFFCS